MSLSDTVISTLYKKFLGIPNTGLGAGQLLDNEYTVDAAPFVYQYKIFSQSIPSTAPDLCGSFISLIGESNPTTDCYQLPINDSQKYIKKYTNLTLSLLKGIPNTYAYADESKGLDNLLKKAIKPSADPTTNTYAISVTANGAPIYLSDYILDADAGVLRIFKEHSAPVRITFWRYEGTTGNANPFAVTANNYGEYLYNGATNEWQVGGSKNIQIGNDSGRYDICGTRNSSIAIGFEAGSSNQNINSIAIGKWTGRKNQLGASIAMGYFAGELNQQTKTIAIGGYAGQSSQGQYSIAIGEAAGQFYSKGSNIAIGNQAGQWNQGINSICIGNLAGFQNISGDYRGQADNSIIINATGKNFRGLNSGGLYVKPIRDVSGGGNRMLYYDTTTGEITCASGGSLGAGSGLPKSDNYPFGSYLYYNVETNPSGEIISSDWVVGSNNVTLGQNAGRYFGEKTQSIAIGKEAGWLNQDTNSIAIGPFAAQTLQSYNSIALGLFAGRHNQCNDSIAIGPHAGENSQDSNSIAIGVNAATYNQCNNSIAFGTNAAYDSQSNNAIAIGANAAYQYQEPLSIAIGNNAGYDTQKSGAISIGDSAGSNAQNSNAIAIGQYAGRWIQEINSIAIGTNASTYCQKSNAIAIGNSAGWGYQSNNAIAIGDSAGYSNQHEYSIAIGECAGYLNQGAYSIAIGEYAGYKSQSSNSIIFNASNAEINPTPSNAGLYINPIREASFITDMKSMYYNITTKEVTYDASGVTSGTSICGSVLSFNAPTAAKKLLYFDVSNQSIEQTNGLQLLTDSSSNITLINMQNDCSGNKNNLLQGKLYYIPGDSNAMYNIIMGGNVNNVNDKTNGGIQFVTYSTNNYKRVQYIQPFEQYSNESAAELHFTRLNSSIATSNGVVFDFVNSKYGFNTSNLTHTVTINGTLGVQTTELNLGSNAGKTGQGDLSIAIGAYAAETNQNSFSVAVGTGAARSNQDTYSIAVGYDAGGINQSNNSVAVGYAAGMNSQGMFSVAIGDSAAEVKQGNGAVSIGASAGEQSQGLNSVAIGANAGRFNQGKYSVAIGYNAGYSNQHNNTVIINATANQITTNSEGATYITPIRKRAITNCVAVYWDYITNELCIST